MLSYSLFGIYFALLKWLFKESSYTFLNKLSGTITVASQLSNASDSISLTESGIITGFFIIQCANAFDYIISIPSDKTSSSRLSFLKNTYESICFTLPGINIYLSPDLFFI